VHMTGIVATVVELVEGKRRRQSRGYMKETLGDEILFIFGRNEAVH